MGANKRLFELRDKNTEILNRVQAAGRMLTPAERQECDQLEADMESIDAMERPAAWVAERRELFQQREWSAPHTDEYSNGDEMQQYAAAVEQRELLLTGIANGTVLANAETLMNLTELENIVYETGIKKMATGIGQQEKQRNSGSEKFVPTNAGPWLAGGATAKPQGTGTSFRCSATGKTLHALKSTERLYHGEPLSIGRSIHAALTGDPSHLRYDSENLRPSFRILPAGWMAFWLWRRKWVKNTTSRMSTGSTILPCRQRSCCDPGGPRCL